MRGVSIELTLFGGDDQYSSDHRNGLRHVHHVHSATVHLTVHYGGRGGDFSD